MSPCPTAHGQFRCGKPQGHAGECETMDMSLPWHGHAPSSSRVDITAAARYIARVPYHRLAEFVAALPANTRTALRMILDDIKGAP